MSIQEIEHAIKRLSPGEVDRLADWIADFRAKVLLEERSRVKSNGPPKNLAEVMGDLLGRAGRGQPGPTTYSRDAGQAFTDHLVKKRQDGRL